MSRFPNDDTNAAAPLHMRPGEKVKFDGDRRWWTVRAVTTHFVALTRQLNLAPSDTLYTVIDWRNGVRGPSNESGNGWGAGTYTEDECARMLAEFEAGELEVSHRKRVPLRITDLDSAGAAR